MTQTGKIVANRRTLSLPAPMTSQGLARAIGGSPEKLVARNLIA